MNLRISSRKALGGLGVVLLGASLSSAEPKGGYFDHTSYQLERKMALVGPVTNFSGIALNPKTNTLFVLDDQSIVYEISKAGAILRTVPLTYFQDPEAITFIDDDRFAVTEEERGTLDIFHISAEARGVGRDQAEVYTIEPSSMSMGLCGAAFSVKKHLFYVSKRTGPKKIFAVQAVDGKLTKYNPFDADLLPIKDILELSINPRISPNLFVLGGKSKRILEVDPETGDVLSSFSLLSAVYFGKPDGFVFDNEGRLYVVAEEGKENFYIFAPKTSAPKR